MLNTFNPPITAFLNGALRIDGQPVGDAQGVAIDDRPFPICRDLLLMPAMQTRRHTGSRDKHGSLASRREIITYGPDRQDALRHSARAVAHDLDLVRMTDHPDELAQPVPHVLSKNRLAVLRDVISVASAIHERGLMKATTLRYLGLFALAGCVSPDDMQVAEQDQPLAVARPASVPSEFVITPAGYFHPSCVNIVSADERIRVDGNIEDITGNLRELVPCGYPHYNKLGILIDDEASTNGRPTPTINGWVENGDIVVSTPLDWISATWQVPTAPFNQNGQTLYYFPGLEDINYVMTIVQPVLGWFNGRWTLASWNCCISGNVNQSTPIDASPGDLVGGYAYGSNCSSGICSNWSIVSSNQATGQSTTLNTSGYGQSFNWAFGGVLEAYGVSNCQQYPANGQVVFYNVALQTTAGAWMTNVSWRPEQLGGTPSCGYSVTTGLQSVAVATSGTVPSGNLTPAPSTSCGQLNAGQGITAGHGLSSCDGRFSLQMQLDGNLVIYQGGTALWSTHTVHSNTFSAIMQGDGNFVAYDLGSVAQFSTRTAGHPGALLAMQSDGNLVIYGPGNVALWSSHTCCH